MSKADVGCPLYPRKRPNSRHRAIPAKSHKQLMHAADSISIDKRDMIGFRQAGANQSPSLLVTIDAPRRPVDIKATIIF